MISSVAALADRLQCTMEPGRAKYYIAPVVTVEVNDFGRARVSDAIVEASGANFVFREVAGDTAKRMAMRWEVRNVKPDPKEDRVRDATLVVRLTVQKASGAAVMTVLDAHQSGAQ